MRLYSGSTPQFIQDTVRNQIADKLRRAFTYHFRYSPSKAEVRSWQNSLRAMSQTIEHAELLDHGVILEYQLPLSSRRLDCLICGHNTEDRPQAVIVELKQWDGCSEADGDNEVVTWLAGAEREVLHPSVQVGNYRMYLEDTHPAFYEEPTPIGLSACCYLHNYIPQASDVLFSRKFAAALDVCPTYTADNWDQLSRFLKAQMAAGRGLDILSRVEENRFRPSRKLMDHVAEVIGGRSEYVLLDEQQVAFDKVLTRARLGVHHRRKSALIIKGGPGTGKSVIALNLMSDLLRSGYNAHYATGSRAFTETLRRIVGPRGSVQFKYFNSYMGSDRDSVDVLICDESHRIREFSHNRFTRADQRTDLPQVEELLKASKVCVFFIDDKQVVRQEEVGSSEYIRQRAERAGCDVFRHELDIQFRCAGSEAFINWVNNTLEIERTPNILWSQDESFDFRVFDSPQDLEDAIKKKAEAGHTARLTAGFCWKWSRGLTSEQRLKCDVVIDDFRRPWNARPEATRLPKEIPKAIHWAHDPNGINQVGCVYTAQGFEFDYVGVIVGNDLTYDLDAQSWEGHRENSHDNVVRRAQDRFLDLVKNTYRVLLSRGMRGCYVYFLDKDTERFFKSRMEKRQSEKAALIAFRNALPLVDLRAVANADYGSLEGLFSVGDQSRMVPVEGGPFPKDCFLVKADGDSMEPRIPDGSLCLFHRDRGGSRKDQIVLCVVWGFAGDAPLALIKKYRSERSESLSDGGIGPARKITLTSLNRGYGDLEVLQDERFEILGVFERVVDSRDSKS